MGSMNSQIEENYLKAIYKIGLKEDKAVSTSAVAQEMGVQSASVTDMLKKLSAKNFVTYKKYHGVSLTNSGKKEAIRIVRKHRLWEVFLVEKLGFGWGDVHEVAEQLEHVNSDRLTNSLDAFLDFPRVDPHGDPIPDENGLVHEQNFVYLTELKAGDRATISGVDHDGRDLLTYLENNELVLHNRITVLEKFDFDGSMKLEVKGREKFVSEKIAENILVQKV
jgi:DtxR family Mn-dependent transcriptional regulator